ncbi:coil containing protein [Vibrio phage 1.111.B._10N.286.45.E6]|nr:coil containing protein [Vibrio phage 1.111.A._10N.286.45.E6]AUR88285.1 coil containing protein [Vibrio phage 1.111.B._10N.286.45.E6]
MELIDKYTGPSQKFIDAARGMDEELVNLNKSRQKSSSIKADLEQYERLSSKLSDHTVKLTKAQAETTELGKAIATTENPSKRQLLAFERSKNSLEKLRKTNQSYTEDVHKLSGQLRVVGVNTANLSVEHRKADAQIRRFDKSIEAHVKSTKIQSIESAKAANKEILRQQKLDRVNEYLDLRKTRRLERGNRIREGEALKHQMRIDRINRKISKTKATSDRLDGYSVQASEASEGLGVTAAAASGIGATALVAINSINQATAEQSRIAAGYGMSYSQFSANDYAAKQVGLNGENIGDLSEELKNKLGEVFSSGSNGSLDEFSEYVGGFDFSALSGKSSQDQFLAITEEIAKIQDSDKRQYFYDSIMGGEAAKLSQGLDKLGVSYAEAFSQGKKYNLMTDEGVKGAEAYALAYTNVSSVAGSAVREVVGVLGNELAPVMNDISNDMINGFLSHKDSIRAFAGEFASGVRIAYQFVTANSETLATIAKWGGYLFAASVGVKAIAAAVGVATTAMSIYTKGILLYQTATSAAAIGTGLLAKAGVVFNAVLLANPIGLVIAGVAALSTVIYGLWKHWDSIVGAIKEGVSWAKELFGFGDDTEISAVNNQTLDTTHNVSSRNGQPVTVQSNDQVNINIPEGANPEETKRLVLETLEQRDRDRALKARQVMYDY